MRKSLEILLFLVKGMLEKNGCLAAFWMGNLKHRYIDGTEAASQIPIEYNDPEPLNAISLGSALLEEQSDPETDQ